MFAQIVQHLQSDHGERTAKKITPRTILGVGKELLL
jgi:hypothetical protein